MKIEDILDPRCIKVPLDGTTKEQVIGQLVDLMAKAGLVENGQELRASALEREGLMSTGIGKGVAIPHGRSKGVRRMAGSFGISQAPVDFGSLDGQPVQMFFFLATPQSIVADHVKALALVSRLLNREDVRAALLKSTTAEQAMKAFTDAEAQDQK